MVGHRLKLFRSVESLSLLDFEFSMEELSITQELDDELEKMFRKMSGPGKLETSERQKNLMRFTTSFAEKQNSFKTIFAEETQTPPEMVKKTAKNITEANQQFDPLVKFIHEKEKEIDKSSANLAQFNKEMNTAITTFLSSRK